MNVDLDFELLKKNLERFLEKCIKSKNQSTTKDLKPSDVNGTYRGFEYKANFGSGNVVKKPSIAFLKEGDKMKNGIYPIIVFISDTNELITCKGVSFDKKPNIEWILNDKDVVYNTTKYADEKGLYSYFRNSFSIDNLDDETIKDIQKDIDSMIADYPIL